MKNGYFRFSDRRRGVALLVSVGLLAVLSVLAVGFAKLTAQDRIASKNFVARVRAQMAAESGLEIASGRLADHYGKTLVDSLDPLKTPWIYGDLASTPLPWATKPSYSIGSVKIDGTTRGYSGLVFDPKRDKDWMPPSYDAVKGIHYALRITDLNTRLNINDPNPNMGSMLNGLGEGIAAWEGFPDPVRGRGSRIISDRDIKFGSKFNSIDDLRTLTYLSRTEVDLLSNYLTTDSWRDLSVIRPKAQTSAFSHRYDFSYPKGKDGKVAGRAPVNVNTAPSAVLYACIKGLRARGLLRSGSSWIFGSRAAFSASVARLIVTRLDSRRRVRPFVSFQDMMTVVPALYRPVFLANANPNLKLLKFNPDLSMANYGMLSGSTAERTDMIDKSDLLYWTTEFCFIAHGHFKIESLGRVVSKQGLMLSESHLAQITKVFEVATHTNQFDFATNARTVVNTKTYPENMADQGAASRGSKLDGQIALNDDTRRLRSNWVVHNDDTMFGPERFRWTSATFDFLRPRKRRELYEHSPPDGAQSPRPRTVLGELEPVSRRTSAYGSNLYADGFYWGRMTGRRIMHHPIVMTKGGGGSSGTPNLHPDTGALEFWFKPDVRGRSMSSAVRALFSWIELGQRARVPSGPWTNTELYCGFLTSSWLNGGGGNRSVRIAGSIHSRARKSTGITYPFSRPYFFLTFAPKFTRVLKGNQWNHVRFVWTRYATWAVFVNGKWVSGQGPWFVFGVFLNVRNVVDSLQVGYLWLHSPWSTFDWDFPSHGTIDQIRTYKTSGWSKSIPYRYRATPVGGSRHIGRFSFGSSAGSLTALSMHYTGYAGVGTIGTRRSFIRVGYRIPSGSSSLGPRADSSSASPGMLIGKTFTSSSGIEYDVRFYDGGQAPFTQTPYLDDVKLFYRTSAGSQVLRRWVVN